MPEYHQKFSGRDAEGRAIQLGVTDGKITALGEILDGEGGVETDFGEALLLPSWIDAHVHFNEPGRTDWEGISSGSRALAAGGGTVFFDMPLNSTPPVLTADALIDKRTIAEAKSWTDFALWGGLTPHSISHLAAMAAEGAIGFKAFLCPSGLDEFPPSDRATLLEGAKIAGDLGLPIAVHAEIGEPFRPRPDQHDFQAWSASRPIDMELAGIELALETSRKTGASFHIVHVTSSAAVDLIQNAKAEGVDVSIETCPHYLLLDETTGAEIGNLAKCAPPLRSAVEVAAMWDRLERGLIDTIGSDHSPCPPDLKASEDLFEVWGGIAGIQHGLPLLLGRSPTLSTLYSDNVADRFKLPNKGGLKIGGDADFMVVESGSFPVADDPPLTRHSHSPYQKMTATMRVKATYLRGEAMTAAGRGKFLKPNSS